MGRVACTVRIMNPHPTGPYAGGSELYNESYDRVPVAGDYIEVVVGKKKEIVIKRVWRVMLPTRDGAPPLVMVEPD